MQLTEERLEGLRVVIMGDESEGYAFFETGKKESQGSWYVSGTGLGRFGPDDKDGNNDYDQITLETLLGEVKGKELTSSIFLGYQNGEEKHRYYTDWEEFAKVVGVSENVALSVKVPKNVAKRFKVFSSEESTPADKLRQLIIDYVAAYMKKNAESLAFQESV